MKRFEIISKRRLADKVNEFKIYAPLVAEHCSAGQFIILRTDDDGERVPFTVCDYSRDEGTVSVLVQEVGYTTARLSEMNAGDALCDFTGPLGNPTDISAYKNILLVAGGIGSAVIYPQIKSLRAHGISADVVLGARNKSLLIYKDELERFARKLYIVTDDGSEGEKGFVTDAIKLLADRVEKYGLVFAVGPLPMMKAVCALTKQLGIKTVVSMNSVMVDGTGMCGCCRVSVNGETKYACIDGPEFDGHAVDFDEAAERGRVYRSYENKLYAEHMKKNGDTHVCNLRGKE